MGDMIPYHQTLEMKQDSDFIVVRFDDFEHSVLIKDWYCEDPECDCMSVGLYFYALHDDTMQAANCFSSCWT